MNFIASLTILSSLYLGVAILERIPSLRFRSLRFLRRHLATDVVWYAVAVINSAVSVFVFRPQLAKLAIGPVSRSVGSLPAAAQVVFGLVLFDAVAYAVHACLHRFDALWAFHKVHHSSLTLDWLAATRAHMFENLMRFVAAQIVLYLIGIPAALVAVTTAIFASFALLDHSNLGINLRWAESVFVTPRLHRRHHIPTSSQHNFGTVFSVWDRMFSKLDTRDTEPHERFGVPGELDTYPQRFGNAFRQPMVEIRQLRAADHAPAATEIRIEEPAGSR